MRDIDLLTIYLDGVENGDFILDVSMKDFPLSEAEKTELTEAVTNVSKILVKGLERKLQAINDDED